MDAIQNIFAAILVLFMVLISGFLYINNLAKDTVYDINLEQHNFQYDQYSASVDTLVKLTEPNSNKDYGSLIADAIYYRNQSLVFNNQTVNLTEHFEEYLDCKLGRGRYYLEAKPRIVQLTMNFIIDGSRTLEEERLTLSSRLQETKARMEELINSTFKSDGDDKLVLINIYSLEEDRCGDFNSSLFVNGQRDPDIRCWVLSEEELYYTPQQNESAINGSTIFIDRSSLQQFKEEHGMLHPNNLTWTGGTNLSSRIQFHTQSDWGSGTAYAIWHNNRTELSKISLFFPVSDQLSTSSIDDNCYLIQDSNQNREYCQYTTCSLCDSDCPADRSQRSIDIALNASADFNSIINPIVSLDCDYQNIYDDETATIWNACSDTATCGSYCSQYGTPNPNWCDSPSCGGCNSDPQGNICFHDNCLQTIQNQMDNMATQTGGAVINLQDISQINLNIESVINRNLESYAIQIGERIPDQERVVVERTIPMPNNVFVDIRLWVYKDVNVSYSCPEDFLGHWKLDEENGTRAIDSSVRENNGNTSFPFWTSGLFNGSLRFNTTNQNIRVHTQEWNLNRFSLSMWVNLGSYPVTPSVGYLAHHLEHPTNGTNPIALYLTNNVLNLDLGFNNTITNITTLNLNQWHHLALLVNNGRFNLYFDATEVAQGEYPRIRNQSSFFVFGNSITRLQAFNGTLDDIRVYDKLLSEEEITAIRAGED